MSTVCLKLYNRGKNRRINNTFVLLTIVGNSHDA